MPQQRIEYGGEIHEFPDSFTDADIAKALKSVDSSKATPAAAQAPSAHDEGLLNAIGRAASSYWEQVNPIETVKGLGKVVTDLPGVVSGTLAAQKAPYDKAKESFSKGAYAEGARHALNYLIPVLGPMLDVQGDKAQAGDVAGSIGGTLGIGTNLLGVEAAKMLPRSAKIPALAANRNPVESAAVEFGKREGIPIDAATATGNRVVKAVQHVADRSLGGGMVAERARNAQGQALAATGERLAARSGPAVSAEQAGQGVSGALKGEVSKFHGEASDAYDALRKMEAEAPEETRITGKPREVSTGILDAQGNPITRSETPTSTMRMGVDITATKAALKPIYDALMRESEITPLIGPRGRAATALDRLMTAPDFAPLSVVDGALGDLKAMARGADMPELRNASQATAAEAVKNLDTAVREAATKAGPDVIKALEEGRQATRSKYAVADVLDDLMGGSTEPVKAFDRMAAPRDTRIDLTRKIAKLAPNEVPKVARAYLDRLLDKATAEGGFGRAKGIAADWEKLGPETKSILFRDPAYVKDLDNFFTLAKRMEDNPNPSGTAHTLLVAGQGGLIFTNPVTGIASQVGLGALSKLMHSKAGVKLLTQGLTVPLRAKIPAMALRAKLLDAGLAPTPALSPATAQAPSDSTGTSGASR